MPLNWCTVCIMLKKWNTCFSSAIIMIKTLFTVTYFLEHFLSTKRRARTEVSVKKTKSWMFTNYRYEERGDKTMPTKDMTNRTKPHEYYSEGINRIFTSTPGPGLSERSGRAVYWRTRWLAGCWIPTIGALAQRQSFEAHRRARVVGRERQRGKGEVEVTMEARGGWP